MAYTTILTETRGRVGVITLNRPERLNAYNREMMGEIKAAIANWNADDTVGAIVMTGAGRAFCAGADVSNWGSDLNRKPGEAPSMPQPDDAGRENVSATWPRFVGASKPCIAAINGPCVGVGLTMILPFDIRIASDQARLALRFVKMGVTPELSSSYLTAKLTGVGKSLELMLTGRMIDGAEAARIGLVNRAVPHDSLMDESLALADEIAANPTSAVMAVKRLTWANALGGDFDAIADRESKELAAAYTSPAFREAVTAFLEKRDPKFS